MIPISKDEWLSTEVSGITYYFLPPVGETERFLLNQTKSDAIDMAAMRVANDRALKELEKEYKGKRKPAKKEWEKIVTRRTVKYLPDEDQEEQTDLIVSTIDRVLVDWKGGKVPFPKDGKPSDCLRFKLLSKLYGWYWDWFELNNDELKN